MLALIALIALGIGTGQNAVLQSTVFQGVIALAAAVFFGIAFIHFSHRAIPPEEAMESRILRKRIDTLHRNWRWLLLCLVVTSGCSTFSYSHLMNALPGSQPSIALLIALAIIFQTVLFSLHTLMGPGGFHSEVRRALQDEFVRELKIKTMRIGYITMMLACAATLLVIALHPAFSGAAITWALYAGYAVPTLYYIIADWRASRDG